MAEAAETSQARAQASADADEWKLLYVRRMSQEDVTEKLTLPVSNQKSFLDSIPEDDKQGYLSRGIIPATYHVQQAGGRYIESDVQILVYFPGGDIRQEICSFELPPLQNGIDLEIVDLQPTLKVQYCWRDKKLHLRATAGYPIYAEYPRPRGWRFLGRKLVESSDVTDKTLRMHEGNMIRFRNAIPSDQLKQAFDEFVGFKVGIWIRGLDCVSGHMKPAETVELDLTKYLFLEISCKEAFRASSEFYRENTMVEVYYQWAHGTPFVAIVPDASVLPLQTGEHYSFF